MLALVIALGITAVPAFLARYDGLLLMRRS
jgi:hypothetical protein